MGEELAREYGVPLLARIPLDPRISRAADEGVPFFLKYPDSPAAREILELARRLASSVEADG